MVLTKEVEVQWNPSNQKHFINLGYDYVWRGKFIVPIEHLPINSSSKIEIECDYCGKKFNRSYKDHMVIYNRSIIYKDSCFDCSSKKNKDIIIYKNNNNLLTNKNNGYWTFKENRLKELDGYIKKYNNVDFMYKNIEGHNIWLNFNRNNHFIPDAIKELGYDLDKIMRYKPIGFYDDINKVSSRISNFIKKYGKFPTFEEIINTLNISARHIQKHGGINNIKRYMSYNDENDLQDDSGFYNSSAYEYIVAQWAIHNNLTYKREQYPFINEGYYRSDFMFYLNNDKILYCEVWGINSIEYNKVKNIKLDLYKKYNYDLISIDKQLFQNNRIDKIQEYLFSLFNPYFDIGFKYIDNEILLPPRLLQDETILNEIMKYSNNINYLPDIQTLKDNRKYNLYCEIIKRYNTYYNFAVKFNKKTFRKTGFWNHDTILETFNVINKMDLPINSKTLSSTEYSGILDAIRRLNSNLMDYKLEYYFNNIQMPKEDLKWLNNIINNKGINIKGKVTSEQQNLAHQILEKYNQTNYK